MSHCQISHCVNRELHSHCQILTIFCSGVANDGKITKWRVKARFRSPSRRSTKLFLRAMLRSWHLNRIRRSTRSGRNTAGRFRIGTTSRSRAGWHKRSASWKAALGGSRIRSSAPTGWRRKSRTKSKSGSSGWPRRRRLRGIAVLPSAVSAAAHARRARVRPHLPALQRNARAVR